MTPILSMRNVSTGYGKRQVLFDVSLDVMHGEILVITGGNGSGKSTLLKAIYGLLPPWNTDAQITFRPIPEGDPVNIGESHLNLRNGLAYLPQKNAVFDDLTVEDNLLIAGSTLQDRNEFPARRDEVLSAFPALQPFLRRKPEQMSGGERQMTALAMVLLHWPRVLLLDEPTAGLSGPNIRTILGCIVGLHRSRKTTILLVEHRLLEASNIASRIVRLKLGRLLNESPAKTTPAEGSLG